jgi:predicted ArsR family transcriptional regulator
MKTNTSTKLLSYINNQTQATPKELATFLNISPQALFRHLKKLHQKGQIIKTGEPPRVYYHLPSSNGEAHKISSPQTSQASLPTHFGNFFIHVWPAQQNLF